MFDQFRLEKPLTSRIDHLVIDVGERIDEAEREYRALGFNLTERGYHSLGSANHLAVFSDCYLELLGITSDVREKRPELFGFPEGLNGVVFASDDVRQVYSELIARDIKVEQPISFSRCVKLAYGVEHAHFELVRLIRERSRFGRISFCHHLTPALVTRKEDQVHPNGAFAISNILIAVVQPERSLDLFRRILGDNSYITKQGNSWRISVGGCTLSLVSSEPADPELKAIWPEPRHRAEYVAVITLRTRSIARTATTIAKNNVRGTHLYPNQILVAGSSAFNVGLRFVEE